LKRFRILCLLGLIGSLVVWILPVSCKPYHIQRDLDDYKILLVEQNSEWGFAGSGLVKVRVSIGFGLPQGGKREWLAPIRQEWIQHVSRSRSRWPVNSLQIRYDEWGPSRTTLDSGVEVTQAGTVFCVPYSVFAIFFALPILWHCFFGIIQKKCERRTSNVERRTSK
jgi:hypothetical protein